MMLGKRIRSDRFLSVQSERQNMINMKAIVDHFYLSHDTHSFMQEKCNGFYTQEEFETNSLLGLGFGDRVFYKLNGVPKEIDEGFKKLWRLLALCSHPDKSKLLEPITHEAYRNNYVVIGKQKIRLFKYIKKHKLLSAKEIENVTTMKQSQQKLYLCISRNPVDYLFASTDQSFTSCLSLYSDYTGAFYMGLPGDAGSQSCIGFYYEWEVFSSHSKRA